MALVVQSYTFLHQYVNSWVHNKPKKSANALNLGIISNAQINAAAGMLDILSSTCLQLLMLHQQSIPPKLIRT